MPRSVQPGCFPPLAPHPTGFGDAGLACAASCQELPCWQRGQRLHAPARRVGKGGWRRFAIWASLLLSCCYGTVEMLPGRWRWWPVFVTSGSFLSREMSPGLAASLPDATYLGRMGFLRVKYTLQIHPFGISVHFKGRWVITEHRWMWDLGVHLLVHPKESTSFGVLPLRTRRAARGSVCCILWAWLGVGELHQSWLWGESWDPAPVIPTYSRISLGAAQLALVTQTGLKLGIALLQSHCAPCDATLWRQKALCPQSIPSHCSSHLLVPEVLAAAGSIQKGPNSTQLCFAQPLFMQNGCPKAKSLRGREAQHQAGRMEEGSEMLGMRRRAGMVLLSWRCLKLGAFILTARVLWDQVCGRCCPIFFLEHFNLCWCLGLLGLCPAPMTFLLERSWMDTFPWHRQRLGPTVLLQPVRLCAGAEQKDLGQMWHWENLAIGASAQLAFLSQAKTE